MKPSGDVVKVKRKEKYFGEYLENDYKGTFLLLKKKISKSLTWLIGQKKKKDSHKIFFFVS